MPLCGLSLATESRQLKHTWVALFVAQRRPQPPCSWSAYSSHSSQMIRGDEVAGRTHSKAIGYLSDDLRDGPYLIQCVFSLRRLNVLGRIDLFLPFPRLHGIFLVDNFSQKS